MRARQETWQMLKKLFRQLAEEIEKYGCKLEGYEICLQSLGRSSSVLCRLRREMSYITVNLADGIKVPNSLAREITEAETSDSKTMLKLLEELTESIRWNEGLVVENVCLATNLLETIEEVKKVYREL